MTDNFDSFVNDLQNEDHTTNTVLYTYKTLLSYMNAFDPDGSGNLASYQISKDGGATCKVITAIPSFGAIYVKSGSSRYYYPNAELMQYFIKAVDTLQSMEIDLPDSIKNFSIKNNVVFLDDSQTAPAPYIEADPSAEASLDIISSAMASMGCPFEFWVSKYSLLGFLKQVQEKAQTKDADERWLISLSWGEYGICDYLKEEITRYGLDVPQDCDAVCLGCPSNATPSSSDDTCSDGSSPCALTNSQYFAACEEVFKDLVENYKCTFFVSSGDTGPCSSSGWDALPYYVDYPTSSQYVVSVGGINYTEEAASGESSDITSLATSIQTGSTGFADAMTATQRGSSVPNMVVGGLSDPTGVPTGGGFTGYGGSANDNFFIKAIDSQKDLVNAYYNNATFPDGCDKTKFNWDTSNPQRGVPDIAACMSNGYYATFDVASNGNPTMGYRNAAGTSFAAPLMAGVFAMLLSYADLPDNTRLIDFIYAHKDLFDKPPVAGTNTANVNNDGTEETVNGYTSTTEAGTWDPCVGIGCLDFGKFHDALTSAESDEDSDDSIKGDFDFKFGS